MKSEILKYFFLAFISVLSLFVLVGDIRHKKIKNKFILIGFAGGLLLFLIGSFWADVRISYLWQVLINTSIAFAVAYFFWSFSFWPAGDAKLFTLFSFLLPLNYYWKSYLPFFPSMMLLVNVFICAYAGLLFLAMLHFMQKKIKINRSSFFSFLNIKKHFLFILSGSFWNKIVLKTLIGRFIILIAVFTMTNYFSHSKNIEISVLIRTSFVGMILWGAASWLVEKYIAEKEVYVEDVDLIESGMTPWIDPGDVEIFSKEFMKKIGSIKAEGLDGRQLELIKARFKSKKISSLKLQRQLPFSPWIIFGMLATIASQDNLLQSAFKVLQWF